MAGVRIPIMGQSVGLSGAGVQAGPSPQMHVVQPDDTLGKSLGMMGQALGQVSRAIQIQQDQDARAWSTNALPDLTLKAQTLLQQQKESAKEAASGFTPGYLEEFDKLTAEGIQNAPNDASKKYLTEHMAALRGQLGAQAMHFEAQSRLNWRATEYSNGIDKWSKIVAGDPGQYDTAVAQLQQTMPEVGPEASTKLKDYMQKSLRQAAALHSVQTDAQGTLAAVDGILGTHSETKQERRSDAAGAGQHVAPAQTGASFDTVMEFVFAKEGGYSASDGNSGAPVNFGINQRANPDIDVKNLTKDKAAAIYKTRYWDVIGADKLSPGAALMAMDAAVNQGPDFAKKIIAESGGDIQKMAELRHNHYVNLVERDPEKYGKYAKNWRSRLEDATSKALALEGQAPGGQSTTVNVPPVEVVEHAPPPAPTWMKDMPADELFQLRQHAATEVQRIANDTEAANQKVLQEAQSTLRLATQNAEAQAQSGVAPSGEMHTREEFHAAFKDPVTADNEFERYNTARQTGAAIAGYKNQPTEALVAVINAPAPDPNDPAFAVKAHSQNIAQTAAAQVIKARAEDPWAYAIQNKEFGAQPINPTAADFGDQLKLRAAALPGMMQKYGVGAAILSKPETAMLSAQLNALPADQRVALLQKIRGSIADDSTYTNFLNTIRKDSPVTAMVGNIAALGGNIQIGDQTVSKDEVARRIAIGEDLLNKTKGDKAADGNRGSFPMPKEDAMRQAWVDQVGSSYAGFPEAEAHAYEAYRAYYASQAAAKGLNDPKQGVDDKIAKEAITAATGGVTEWGGHWGFGSGKLILPYGMPASDFKDSVAASWAQISQANGYTKTTVDEIGLQPTGQNGVYMVMSGTSWLPGKDGKPIMIDATRNPRESKGRVH